MEVTKIVSGGVTVDGKWALAFHCWLFALR
jgi:hypothetical protein